MTQRHVVGVALGNGRFQDELCDVLARHVQVERCRTDRELLALLAQHAIAGAVVGQELLGLDRAVLPALRRHELPTVLLVPTRDVQQRQTQCDGASVRVLPLGAAPEMVAAAVDELFGDRPRVERVGSLTVEVRRPEPAARVPSGRVYAFVGAGGTGCTTVVANTLIALGAAQPVVAVDLDPVAPLLVPLLNADPSLGLDGVIRAGEAGVSSLERALAANLQPLPSGVRAPHAQLLGGLPLNGDRRAAVSVDLAAALLASLADRGGIVLADVGRLLPGTERPGLLQRAGLLAADGVIVVSAGDRPGVLRTCDGMAHLLATDPHPALDRLVLVVNRYHAGTMDAPSDIAGSIGLPLAACVAADEAVMRRAVHSHQPVVVDGTGEAARELLGLAEALAAGSWPFRVTMGRPWPARLLAWGRRRLVASRRPAGSRPTARVKRAARSMAASPEGGS